VKNPLPSNWKQNELAHFAGFLAVYFSLPFLRRIDRAVRGYNAEPEKYYRRFIAQMAQHVTDEQWNHTLQTVIGYLRKFTPTRKPADSCRTRRQRTA
jgi:hypothetical protein